MGASWYLGIYWERVRGNFMSTEKYSMDKMGEKAPGGRREIQVELGPWACPDGKG